MQEGNRLSYLVPQQMDVAQKEFYDDVVQNMGSPDLPHVWMLPEGQLNGPFTAMLHFPDVGRALYQLQRKIVQQKQIPKDIAELVILRVVCHEGAQYGIYAHTLLAEKAGLSQDTIAALLAGRRPAGLAADAQAAYDLADALCGPGPVADDVYAAASACFGGEGTMTLACTVGLFKFLAAVMNTFNEPRPE